MWQADIAHLVKGYPKSQETFDKLQARCREQVIRLNAEGRCNRTGVPDGWARSKDKISEIHEASQAEAKEIVSTMIDEKLFAPDCKEARQAMETAIEIMLTADNSKVAGGKKSPLYNGTLRMSAARMIMEYGQRKPVTKTEVAVGRAEDWLAALAKDTE